MTFSNLKKADELQRKRQNPYDDPADAQPTTIEGEQSEFNQEQVEAQWFGMCMRMQNKKDFIGLANRMKSIVPKITSYPDIEVVVDNQLLLDDILRIKNRIRSTFVLGLHNSDFTLSYRLADAEEVGKILSKAEVLQLMLEKSTAIKKLVQGLKLTLA